MNKKSNYRFGRKYDTRKEYKTIYIFTEGEETEPNYFNFKKNEIETGGRFKRKKIKIEIEGKGDNTVSLVNKVLNFIEEKNINLKIDECWVVFDKDDFDKNFDNAINKAESNNLKVAYSNESFELWYILHFNLLTSAISRKDYIQKLTNNLRDLTGDKKIKYSKTSKDTPALINSKEKDAIQNAKKLLIQHKKEKSFVKKNPSTTVHKLIENLNKLKDN